MFIRFVLLTFFYFFISPISFSQNGNSEYQAVYSGYANVAGGKVDFQTAKLIFNPLKSVWFQLPSDNPGLIKDTTIETHLNGKTSTSTFYSVSSKNAQGFVYKDFKTPVLVFEYKTIFIRQKNQDYFYSDSLHPMTWKLISEEKEIAGIKCYKAETEFRGRHYTAWYAPSIPVHNGPWKFGGLPGLIIEVYEVGTKSIYWKLISMEPSKEEIPATHSYSLDFASFKQVYKKGVQQYIDAMEGSGSVDPDCPTCTPGVKVQTIENLY